MAYRENNNLRLVDNAYRKDKNKVKISVANTFEHEMIKLKVCYLILKKKHEFMTEVHFINGGRADILDLTNGTIYEILISESKKSILKKKQKYPGEFNIVEITKKDFLGIEEKILE